MSVIDFERDSPNSLLRFIFIVGVSLDLPDQEFLDWATDLASLTLLISAYYEGLLLSDPDKSGADNSLWDFLFSLFFKSFNDWPNFDSVRIHFETTPGFEKRAARISEKLMRARKFLDDELRFLDCDLGIVMEIWNRIEDRDRSWQPPVPTIRKTVPVTEIRDFTPKILRINQPRFRYIFKIDGDKRIVIHQNLEDMTGALLEERPDLYQYRGGFDWGRIGTAPRYLVYSLLAHHFGHTEFGTNEVPLCQDRCRVN